MYYGVTWIGTSHNTGFPVPISKGGKVFTYVPSFLKEYALIIGPKSKESRTKLRQNCDSFVKCCKYYVNIIL